jgi:hypothetical protein
MVLEGVEKRMVKGMCRKRTKSILCLVIFVLFLCIPHKSCDYPIFFQINCSECYTDEPNELEIAVTVNKNDENQRIPITIFFGPFEDNKIALIDTVTSNKNYYWLQTNKQYTLMAEYYKNGRRYIVISGLNFNMYKDYESCSEPCYYVFSTDVDLKLKY